MENTLFTFISLSLSHLLLIRIVYPKWLNDLFVVVVVAFLPHTHVGCRPAQSRQCRKTFCKHKRQRFVYSKKKKKIYISLVYRWTQKKWNNTTVFSFQQISSIRNENSQNVWIFFFVGMVFPFWISTKIWPLFVALRGCWKCRWI